jgi:hypothetical protein
VDPLSWRCLNSRYYVVCSLLVATWTPQENPGTSALVSDKLLPDDPEDYEEGGDQDDEEEEEIDDDDAEEEEDAAGMSSA